MQIHQKNSKQQTTYKFLKLDTIQAIQTAIFSAFYHTTTENICLSSSVSMAYI